MTTTLQLEGTVPPLVHRSPWPVISLARGYEVRLGKMLQPQPTSPMDRPTPYLKAAHVQWSGVVCDDLPEMYSSPADTAQYAVLPGDLLVCEGGDVGRAMILGDDVPAGTIIQNSLHRVRPRPGYSIRYLRYVLEAIHAIGWLEVLCNRATIAHLTREKPAALQIPAPPPSDQAAIAAFLDRETARIDGLIGQEVAMQELLAVRAASAASRECLTSSVTARWLQPSAPTWLLAAMPDDWQASRCKHLFTEIDERSTTGRETLLLVSIAVGVLPRDQWTDREARADTLEGYKLVAPGDFVIKLRGDRGPQARGGSREHSDA